MQKETWGVGLVFACLLLVACGVAEPTVASTETESSVTVAATISAEAAVVMPVELTLTEEPVKADAEPVPEEDPAGEDTAEPQSGDAETEPVKAPITLVESASMPLPGETWPVPKRTSHYFDGTVLSTAPLREVACVITDADGRERIAYTATFPEEDGITEYRLLDETFAGDCFARHVTLGKRRVGGYHITLTAQDWAGNTAGLYESDFAVTYQKYAQLTPNDLRCNYETALAFFGSPERFLFTYKRGSGSSISPDKEWKQQYLTTVTGLNGREWTVHVDAKPYFEQAVAYLENTHVRVTGTNRDTGVIALEDLVDLNGLFLPRFTNDSSFVSHHSFGTAIDINAHDNPNKNAPTHRDQIYEAVTQYLTYDGIQYAEDGTAYYAYTFTGRPGNTVCHVPDTILNYLLYELAFYRAGFAWGIYYPHTSDAMHFTLTELDPALFEEGPYAMRKVFAYAED